MNCITVDVNIGRRLGAHDTLAFLVPHAPSRESSPAAFRGRDVVSYHAGLNCQQALLLHPAAAALTDGHSSLAASTESKRIPSQCNENRRSLFKPREECRQMYARLRPSSEEAIKRPLKWRRAFLLIQRLVHTCLNGISTLLRKVEEQWLR